MAATTIIVDVDRKGRMVVPQEVRERLGMTGDGDKVLVEVEGDSARIRKAPKSWAEHMWGLGKEVWQGTDTDEYMRKERAAWDRRSP